MFSWYWNHKYWTFFVAGKVEDAAEATPDMQKSIKV